MTDQGGAPRQDTATSAGRWSDLRQRLLTGSALGVIGLTAVWIGGTVFAVFVALCVAVIVWELAEMVGSSASMMLAGLSGGCAILAMLLPGGYGLPFLFLPVLVAMGRIGGEKLTFAAFTGLGLVAGYGLVSLRTDAGALWLVWLVLVVAATDIMGYFAGKLIGGPKFWPKVSPKKTWAGTVAGWVGAAGVALGFIAMGHGKPDLIPVSISLSMAAQFGDICESAMKRRLNVKDSSQLLPGHGGFFDRFDGVLGASVFLLLITDVTGYPLIEV